MEKVRKNREDEDNNRLSLGLRREGNSAAEIVVGGKREENITRLTAAGGSCQQR